MVPSNLLMAAHSPRTTHRRDRLADGSLKLERILGSPPRETSRRLGARALVSTWGRPATRTSWGRHRLNRHHPGVERASVLNVNEEKKGPGGAARLDAPDGLEGFPKNMRGDQPACAARRSGRPVFPRRTDGTSEPVSGLRRAGPRLEVPEAQEDPNGATDGPVRTPAVRTGRVG
jgi:hypothetical protein